MIKLNPEVKDRINKSFEFIYSNNLNETELQAELTGLALFCIENFRSSLCITDIEHTQGYLRKRENNYEK